MLNLHWITSEHFASEEAGRALLSAFTEAGEAFTPTHFSENEPVRTPFDPADPGPVLAILSTFAGDLLLKGRKASFTAFIRWNRVRPKVWSLWLGQAFLSPRGLDEVRRLALGVTERLPPVFGYATLADDERAKHLVTDPQTGRSMGTRGGVMLAGEGLPGVYWLTLFGPPLVSFFGKERLLGLPAHEVVEVGDHSLAVFAYPRPDEGDAAWRREKEQAIVEALGREYFFDLEEVRTKKRPRKRTAIPGLTYR